MWIAANRDPRVFDNPEVVNIARSTGASLVWGRGIYFCMGAPLGRLEMRVALEELLSRTKLLELGGAAPLPRSLSKQRTCHSPPADQLTHRQSSNYC